MLQPVNFDLQQYTQKINSIAETVNTLIEQNFHSVAIIMRHRFDLGGAGGSKTLAWGFAMAPHRLCLLVLLIIIQIYIGYFVTAT